MTDTKQITFEGREYTVPAWVEWVTRDHVGTFAYLDRPARGEFEWLNTGESFIILDKNHNTGSKDWRDSLTKV